MAESNMGPKWRQVSHLMMFLVTLAALSNLCCCSSQQQQQRQDTIATASTTTSQQQQQQIKPISETSRSQNQRNSPGTGKKKQEDQLARRDGGHQLSLSSPHHHHHLTMHSNLPPELVGDDGDTGEVFVNEDGSYESTGASTAGGLLTLGDGSPAPEYEADGSGTELLELPPNVPASVAAQMEAQTAVHNLRLLRQSSPPTQTRFNLDQRRQQQQQQQVSQQQQQQQQQQQPAPQRNMMPINSVVTTTMATRQTQVNQPPPSVQMMNNIAPRAFQQQAAAQAQSQQALEQQQQQQQSSSFNVNMGADRMLIKPQQQPTTTAQYTSTGREQEMVTESVNNHELLSRLQNSQPALNMNGVSAGGGMSGSLQGMDTAASHQNLIYLNQNHQHHSGQAGNEPLRQPMSAQAYHDQFRAASGGGGGEAQVSAAGQAICYTPVALLMVILVTMLVTVVVCFATHIVIKHLGRHQFDLIANSKHFDTKPNGSGYLTGAADGRRAMTSAGGLGGGGQVSGGQKQQQQFGMAGLLGSSFHDAGPPFNGKPYSARAMRPDELAGCAFDNPYFRDESQQQQQQLAAGYLRHPQQQQSTAAPASATQSTNLDQQQHQRAPTSNQAQQQQQPPGKEQAIESDQLDFIENHISNLHNKQVTSSVKELSILSPNTEVVAANHAAYLGPVVDLTSEEQRTKVITDPREGDLVAVDLTGHDFIGLGFDVCGNAHEGIFVRSVLSRGPARESGCIHPGDRIKCLNISFDNITLQDACDILNCGSPYKLRLLLEKRALPAKLLAEKHPRPQPAPINRRLPRPNHLLQSHQMVMASGGAPTKAQQQSSSHSLGGPFSATKSYIKRLAQLMAPGGGNGSQAANQRAAAMHLNYRDQFGITTPPAFSSSEHQLLEAGGHIPHGSAHHHHHIRRRPSAGNSLFSLDPHSAATAGVATTGAHINPGYGTDDDDDDGTGDELALAVAGGAHRARVDSIGSAQLGHNYHLRGPRQFSVNSADVFSVGSQVGGGGAYNSLSYQNRNAHHRLHGPPLGQRDERRLADPAQPLNQLPGEPIDGSSGSTQVLVRDQHLEQTQSQPEIAQPEGGGQQHHEQRPAGGRAPITNSMSTPTMNLLLTSGSQQQQQQQAAAGEAGPAKPSSGRRKDDSGKRKKSVRGESSAPEVAAREGAS